VTQNHSVTVTGASPGPPFKEEGKERTNSKGRKEGREREGREKRRGWDGKGGEGRRGEGASPNKILRLQHCLQVNLACMKP
jgi:hypothetical protein